MVKFSEAAAEDIEIIFERSVTDFGLNQTELYYSSLKKCFDLLDNNQQMGSEATDVKSGYHRFIHQSHVIFYRISDEGIFIIRILHKRMDIAKHLD